MLNYEIITDRDSEKCQIMERFVACHSCGHFLQLPRWGRVKQFWQWRGLLAYRDGVLTGAMSVLVRKLPLGLSFFYAPRGPVCDRNDQELLRVLLDGARELANREHSILLILDPDEPDENTVFRKILTDWSFRERQDKGFGNIQAQYVMRLPLEGRETEELFAAFSAKTRYDIRRALRKGVQLRRFYGDDPIPEQVLEDFVRLNVITGQRDGFLPRDKAYFQRVLETFGRDAVLFMAYLDTEPIAGTIGLYAAGKAWYLYGASGNTHRDTMPNYLLQWEMIRHALQRRCRFYDLRGVPGDLSEDGPLYGLYRFKKQFLGQYTKFTGLFYYGYRPLLARCFWMAWQLRRKRRRPGAGHAIAVGNGYGHSGKNHLIQEGGRNQ